MILISAGVILAALGWQRIYQAEQQPVTDGIYGVIRHPQYAGFWLIIIGFVDQWPTLLTLIMAPIFQVMYTRLAPRKEEEEEFRTAFREDYEAYTRWSGRLFPEVEG